jgi:hypothetical protein
VPLAATVNEAVFPAMIVWLAGCVVMAGATVALVTLSTAVLLVTLPALLLTATVNCALLFVVVSAGVVYVAEVAPLIAVPFMLHWYVNVAVPLAATVNEAVFPATIVWLAGCVVMAGATVALVTVRTAALLAALPALLLTATVNFALLSVAVSAGVVYADDVAPLIAAPFLLHWYVMGDVPVAATVNEAALPAITVWLAGCDVMVGATTGLVTVSMAALLVALPTELLTVAVNFALLAADVSAGVVYEEEFAPLIAAPFILHWYVMGAVPVAATLNVAVCPVEIFALAGCDEIAGGIDALATICAPPVPLSATEIDPRGPVNSNVPV